MRLKKIFIKRFLLPFTRNELEFCFYIEKKARFNGSHVVHLKSCELLPEKSRRNKLGFFENFKEVVKAGEEHFEKVKLCPECCNSLYDVSN